MLNKWIEEAPHFLHITSLGKILHKPRKPQGVVIYAEDDKPIITVNEVSDDEVINIFMDVHGKSSGIAWVASGQPGRPDDYHAGWEILANLPRTVDSLFQERDNAK